MSPEEKIVAGLFNVDHVKVLSRRRLSEMIVELARHLDEVNQDLFCVDPDNVRFVGLPVEQRDRMSVESLRRKGVA
jgi:hypothetical protein